MNSEDNPPKDMFKEQMPWLNSSIPTVDPLDLKALWQQSKDLEAQPHQPGVMTMISREAAACSPTADITSIIFRLSMLDLANRAMGLNLPVTPDGKPTDVVFNAFATIPMTGIPSGGGDRMPFDVYELVKIIVKESEA